jgi:adenylate cyclase
MRSSIDRMIPAIDRPLDVGGARVTGRRLADEPRGLGHRREELGGGDAQVVGGDVGGRQPGVDGQRLGVSADQEVLVETLVDHRIVAGGATRDAERAGRGGDLRPQRPQHVGRRVLALARVQRRPRPPLALGLDVLAERAREHRDHEARGRRRQHRLGGIALGAGQLDEAMADEGCLAEQQVLGRGVLGMPGGDRGARPPSDRQADQPVGDAAILRIGAARFARLEDRTGDVPLQEVDRASARVGEMRELAEQQALAGAGQSGEKHQPCLARQRHQRRVQRRGLVDHPDIMPVEPRPMERKLAAILSADVKGYSRLMGDDEVATVRTITDYRESIATAVTGHGGRVVDAPGDNLLAEFASVVDAVRCAVEIQRELGARNAALPASRQMQFRIGINLGDVIVEGPRLYGDGVNIAARLESLAEAGGVCLSGPAYDQVEGKLPHAYDFLGEHTVKNIARPVRVYRLRLTPGARPAPRAGRRRRVAIGAIALLLLVAAAASGWWLRSSRSSAHLALPDRPSVAVLPFTNLSQDPAQEYFSDGVTEDLITGLSKVSGLFVIARNSVFTYKGKPAKIRDVGRDLGVRYVLEGGVQRSGSRVRITAQLVDAGTGYHVWAERYDREVRDIFAVQDEVTQRIVRALAVKLSAVEQGRLARPPADPEAYDLVLRGEEERRRTTREANAEARRLFVKALDLDPEFARAYVGLSWAHLQSWQFLWSADPETLERARELAERAISLDDTMASGHALLAQIYLWKKQHDRAIAEAERAIGVAPNNADGYETLAEVLGWAGRPQESLKAIQHAMRLNPHYPFFYLWTLGHAYYLAKRPAEAVDALTRLLAQNPNFVAAHAYLGVLYTEMGRDTEARAAWEQANRIGSGASLASIGQRVPYQRPADLDRLLTAARKAGLR